MSAIFFWGSLAGMMGCIGVIVYAIFIVVRDWKHYDSQTRINAVGIALKGIIGVGFIALVCFIVFIISWTIYEPGWWQILGGLIVGTVIGVMVFDAKKRERDTANFVAAAMAKNKDNDEDNDDDDSRLSMATSHIEKAREAERAGDYFGARVSYMQSVETLKAANQPKVLKDAKNEYAEFVRRDPVFNKMLPYFIDGVRQNPGILQSDITAKAEDMDWDEIRQYGRAISKDDIRYVFYFAEEFGLLIRQKKGRSYQLYLPEHSHLIEQKEAAEPPTKKVANGNSNEDEEKSKLRADVAKKRFENVMASDGHPYILYRTGNTLKCQADHLEWNGLILAKDDQWWNDHLPPIDKDCTCFIQAITESRKEKLEAEGITLSPDINGNGGGTIRVKTSV